MKGKIVGIDPSFTATGIVIAHSTSTGIKVFRHSVMSATGETWYEKCDDVADRVKGWLLQNTVTHELLNVMIEEPVNMLQSRAWSAALQNRLLSLLINHVTDLGLEDRIIKIATIQPMSMKKRFTDNGHAKKDEMIEKAMTMYKFKDHWSMKVKEAVADAIGVAYCGWLHYHEMEEDMKGVSEI